MKKFRRADGFTLVELLTVVLIIGILAAIAVPNFVAAKKNAQNSEVRGNMRTTQIAAEGYATDTGGNYGTADLIRPYYPGGAMQLGGTNGVRPRNPTNGTLDEPCLSGGPTTSAAINGVRSAGPAAFGTAGRHSYDQAEGTTSYSILGCDCAVPSTQIAGSGGKTLVLSNQ
ncbi:MAG: type II secretion system GspH family protein [Candidatus Obscuribacterales bacterium]|nr:type II secretion system GspH family protein [Candidatus Obscuribacterales bacterium]